MTLSCLLATEPTDAALLRDSAENPEASGVLYDRYARQLLAFVYRRTACPQTAADVVAETFAEAFVARERFTDLGLTAKPWLFTIARRQLSRWYRTQEVSAGARRRLGIPHLAIDDVSLARIEAEIDFEPIRQQVHAALEELPAGQAQAVSLRVGEELPYAEVARRLGCTEGAARVRVSRALAAMASHLDNQEDDR
ncbi:sigma-70 family RNA polymerase sigma factor [soil metagenome]